MAKEEMKEAANAVSDPKSVVIPLKFACLKGFPKSAVLKPDVSRRDAGGHAFITYGIVARPAKIYGRKDVRVLDVARMPCCTRSQDQYLPEDVAKMLMASKDFSGQSPTLVTWEYWQALETARIKKQADRTAEDAQEKQELMAKFGKRGAAI